MRGQSLNGGIGELLPAQRSVAVGLVGTYRQRSVQQQHALLCPARQVARGRNRCAEVGLYLLEDVLQRRREHHPVLHREAQPVGLSRLVVRVLSDDHHFRLVEWAEVEGVENEFARRVAGAGLVFLSDGFCQLSEVGLLKLWRQLFLPRWFYLYVHLKYYRLQISVLFSHVFPVATRHVAELLLRVHPLFDADGLEVGAPQVLEQLVVLAQHVVIHLAVR